MILRSGANRWTLLIGKRALKIARHRYGRWNNLNEAAFGPSPLVAPTRAYLRGWIATQPRCEPVSRYEWETLKYGYVREIREHVPCERKPCSFGWLGDRLVAVDYGWPGPYGKSSQAP